MSNTIDEAQAARTLALMQEIERLEPGGTLVIPMRGSGNPLFTCSFSFHGIVYSAQALNLEQALSGVLTFVKRHQEKSLVAATN